MVHIAGPYYFDSDGVRNFTLFERKTVTGDAPGKTAKEGNIGKTYDSPIGYYATLPALMQGYIRQQAYTIAQSQEVMELAAFISKMDALTRAVSFTLQDQDGASYQVSVQKIPSDKAVEQ